jgi:hypothetical protein
MEIRATGVVLLKPALAARGRGTHSREDGGMSMPKTGSTRQVEFVEWTEDAHLRRSRFTGLHDDKKANDVRRAG